MLEQIGLHLSHECMLEQIASLPHLRHLQHMR